METGYRQLTNSDINTITTTKMEEFGAIAKTGDGREFVYVGFGGTSTINPGYLLVNGSEPANSTALAITAVGTGGQAAGNLVAGSMQLVLTNGATAVTQDQFQYIDIFVSAGGSYKLKLRGNTAAAANTGYITCYLRDPLPLGATTLIPGTDTASLRLSKYNGCLPSLTKRDPVGVTMVPIPNTATVTNYGWVQTRGAAYVAATSATLGQALTQDTGGTAGFFMNAAAATDYQVGVARASAVSSLATVTLNLS